MPFWLDIFDLEVLESKMHQTHISRHFIYASMISFSHKPQILLSFISAAQYLEGVSRASDYTALHCNHKCCKRKSTKFHNQEKALNTGRGLSSVIVVKIKTKVPFQI